MRVVAALGGNALLQRGEAPDADIQEKHVLRAARALTPVAIEHDLVFTHGNGPQVGVLTLESALDPALSHPYPFEVLGAQTQGMTGYWLLQALGNALPGREVACLVCRTLVAAGDPAFSSPAKFVGPAYREAEARRLAAKRGRDVRQGGTAWRRVVPSPEPAELLDLPAIRRLGDDRVIVICAGGGASRSSETPAAAATASRRPRHRPAAQLGRPAGLPSACGRPGSRLALGRACGAVPLVARWVVLRQVSAAGAPWAPPVTLLQTLAAPAPSVAPGRPTGREGSSGDVCTKAVPAAPDPRPARARPQPARNRAIS